MAKLPAKRKKERPQTQTVKPERLDRFLAKGAIQEIWGKGKLNNLFMQVDGASLVFFRVFFALILLWEVSRYLSKGWITEMFTKPIYHFNYWPFEWLSPLPGNGMTILFVLMGVMALFILLGLFYRFSIVAFFIGFSYMFLLEQTRYLNHFYLVIIMGFVMIFLPLNRSAALDTRLFKGTKSETVPLWALWIVRVMIAVPYFYGGVAKITPDWLRGEPLVGWLKGQTNFPIIGGLFEYPITGLVMSYSGLLLDLLVIPALLFKKTRKIGFLLLLFFHLLNASLFNIGIFPWFMIVASTLFFEPSWPRRVVNALGGKQPIWPMKYPGKEDLMPPAVLHKKHKIIIGSLVIWTAIHLFIPLRPFFYPGTVHWTEEGHRFSWHMKLRNKVGRTTFIVKDKNTGTSEIVDPRQLLLPWQYQKMSIFPYLIWQFADYLKKEYALKGMDVAVYANASASLNGRAFQPLVDPTVDLTSVPRPVFSTSRWIVPLTTPLNEKNVPTRNQLPPQ